MLDVPDLDTANRCAVVTTPSTGRAPISYRRAAELFESHTDHYDGGPYTLHQLRHSRLTHAAEDSTSTPVLMKPSGHASVPQPRHICAGVRRRTHQVPNRAFSLVIPGAECSGVLLTAVECMLQRFPSVLLSQSLHNDVMPWKRQTETVEVGFRPRAAPAPAVALPFYQCGQK
jgi:hypothetical protein